VTIDGVMYWWVDLLNTYTHHLELQVITALSLISTLYISPQQPSSLFPACYVFISRSLATASNSGDSWASCLQVLSSQSPGKNSTNNWQLNYSTILSQPPMQNSYLNWLLTTPRLAAITHQPPSLLFTGWLSTDKSQPTGCSSSRLYNSSARTTSKTPFFYCVCVHFHWNMFTEPLLRNGCLFILLLHSKSCTVCFKVFA
jgi:hypothetical protein